MPHRTVTDPVCGMEVKAKDVENRSQHQGSTYYFCSSVCKEQFEANPDKYAQKKVA
jgi:P-type Cu+ transporter